MKRYLPLAAALLLFPLGGVQAEGVRQTIAFPKGQSSATVTASVVRGDTDRYEMTAKAGQTMTVGITAKERNAAFTIYRPGYQSKTEDGVSMVEGPTLAGAGEGEDATRWHGALPDSGTYLIEVGGTRGNASYVLKVGIR